MLVSQPFCCPLEETIITQQLESRSPSSQEGIPYLTVVIPAYNEAARLPQTLQKVTDYLARCPYSTELLVVDDGSTDNTVAQAEAIADQHENVWVIQNDHRGKAYTVRTGMLAGTGDYILFSDADLAVPIEELEKLLPYFDEGFDVVIASREGQGARRIGEPFYRHLMGRVFNFVVRFFAVGGFQDTQCGFKIFRRAVAHDLFNRVQLYGEDARQLSGAAVTGFDVEVLFLALKCGYKVKEVPTKWIYGTETKVNPIRDGWRNFKDVVTVRWYDFTGRYKS